MLSKYYQQSPAKSWYKNYDNCAFSSLGQRKPYYNYQTTRVLENFLISGESEIKKVVDYINDRQDLPQTDKHATLW